MSLDAQISTLHSTIFLQVIDYLCHNGSRDGKAITCIGTGLREEHGVDANELAFGVDEGATGVALVDSGISLYEALHAVGSERACLGTDDARSDGVVQSKGVTHSDDPFADFQIVGVADRKCGQVLAIDLDQCKVCGRVGADDAARAITSAARSVLPYIVP